MPVIARPTRRDMMRVACGALAGSLTHRASAVERTGKWALLSDTHISAERDGEVRGFVPFRNLGKAAAFVAGNKPDGCIIAGDLARLQGTPGDYAQLRQGLAPILGQMPVGFCMGNHDDRENFTTAFAAQSGGELQPVREKRVAVIQRLPVRIILLDSLIVTNETPGYLGKAQRTWLDKYLSSADSTPTLLFVHHTLDDEDSSLLDSDRLLRLAARHRSVKAIFYGHSHRYHYDTFEGVHLVNIPSLGYSFMDTQPVGWLQAEFTASGAEIALAAIAGNTSLNGAKKSLEWRT